MVERDAVPMEIDSDSDDPITASYPIFLNPSLPSGRRLLVLQHPNRTDDAPRPSPTELRIKTQSGMVEVDVPLDYNSAYDRDKGLRWGRTLQQSMAAKNGGSHGLAGGFGFGAVQQRGSGGARKRNDAVEDDDVIDWGEAIRQDKVLRTQTLGGQYPDADEVQYMVGVFQGEDLHLTPVSSLVHLRPQLHHIDAITQMERQAASSSNSKDVPAGASGASGSAGTGAGAARAIHMTIKTTADGESVTAETIADRLRFVQSEPWRKLRYTDENEEAAWDVYSDSLFLSSLHPQQQALGADGNRSGKDGGIAKGKDAAFKDTGPLAGSVPTFGSKWSNKQLLEAVSGIKKPDPEVAVRSAIPAAPDPARAPIKQEPGSAKTTVAGEGRKPTKARTRGGSAAAALRRGGRSKVNDT